MSYHDDVSGAKHAYNQIIRCYAELRKQYPDIAANPKVGELVTITKLLIDDTLETVHYLAKLVRVDSLTGLGNRTAYDEALFREADRAKQHGHPLSIIRADIDKFKIINDTYGHESGDVVLKGISEIFKQNIHTSDIANRWGGDEFAILLPETDVEEAEKVAKRLNEATAVHMYYFGSNKIGPVTLSQGVAALDPKEMVLDVKVEAMQLAQNADEAAYQAKKAGGNRICIYTHEVGG